MATTKDLSGMKFNLLTVRCRHGSEGKRNRPTWECICDCGETTIVRGENLKSNAVKSCGCLRKKSPPNKTHGLRQHELYGVWQNIKNRCYNKNVPSYLYYGATGINVCKEWKSDFQIFYTWCIQNGWKNGRQIDRIDNRGNYSPENCRFATSIINNTNKGPYKNNTSGYTGVSWSRNMKKWIAVVSFGGTLFQVGFYETTEEAVMGRNYFICALRFPHKIQPIRNKHQS